MLRVKMRWIQLITIGTLALACGTAVPPPSQQPSHSTSTTAPSAAVAGAWAESGHMAEPRGDGSTATRLANGKVLVVGGENADTEIYDPGTGEFVATEDTTVVRLGHTATLLADGSVLVVGGFDGQKGIASAELYDPASASWTATGPLHDGRFQPTATLLEDGRVLIVAGWKTDAEYLATSEIYDPNTRSWSQAGVISDARGYHGAVLLSDGTVLVAGGQNEDGALATAELFDPATSSWTHLPGMAHARSYGSAVLLEDGRVLVAGGGAGDPRLQSAELFDPETQTWAEAATMTEPRSQHVAVRLPDGRVLAAGGGETHKPTAELYDPTADNWTQTGAMASWRASPLVALLADGRVFVGGGFADDATSTELFDPTRGGPVASVPPWFSRCEPGCQGPIIGAFTSNGFLPGLQLSLGDDDWFNSADYSEEIQFERGDDVLRFWRNAGASSLTGSLLTDVPMTPDGLSAWLAGNSNVSASVPEQMTIDGVAATTLTVTISPDNVNVDPECPSDVRSCLRLLWIAEGHDFAIGYGEAVRLFLLTIDTDTGSEMIVISLDAPNNQGLTQLTADFEPVLTSLQLP